MLPGRGSLLLLLLDIITSEFLKEIFSRILL